MKRTLWRMSVLLSTAVSSTVSLSTVLLSAPAVMAAEPAPVPHAPSHSPPHAPSHASIREGIRPIRPVATTPTWSAGLQRRLAEGQYRLQHTGDAVTAYNPAQALHARWDVRGTRLERTGGDARSPLHLRATGWGRDSLWIDASGNGSVRPSLGGCRSDGAVDETGSCLRRLELAHPGLLETWENRKDGLEQGFELQAPPEFVDASGEALAFSAEDQRGDTPLSIGLAIDGAGVELEASTDGRATAAVLWGDDGGMVRYSGLKVWDARGEELPAWLEEKADGLSIRVDDAEALYPLTIDPLLTTAAWVFESDVAGAAFGFMVTSGGDVNGDGFGDVLVGANNQTNGQVDEGRAYLFLGSATGLSLTPAWTAESDQASAYFGQSLASAGDVNGDGFGDVIVGAVTFDNGQTDEGRAYLYLGSATGLSATPVWTAESDQASAYFGQSVASAGDVNGDGFSDVLVGACYYDNGQTNEGRAYLYLGSSTGLSTTAAWITEPNVGGAVYGWAVAGAGDVNGDGYSDVAIGANNYANGQGDEGGVFLYYGSAAGLPTTANTILESNQASAYLGQSVASAGDVNGDGYSDVIAGAPYYDNGQTNEGRASLYLGSASGVSSTPAWNTESDQASALHGFAVSTAGDVNGDGFADVIVGTFGYDNGQGDEGRAYVYLGSATGLSTTAVWQTESDQGNAYYGYSVGSAGDVNGDGFGEFIVGAYQWDNGQNAEGKAWLYAGAGGLLSTASAASVAGENNGDGLGESVADAGDVDGDGYGDVLVGASNFSSSRGKAYLFKGTATGMATTPAWTAQGEAASAFFGTVASAGDVNGDGFADVIVGAARNNSGTGKVYLYLGAAGGLSTTAAWTREGEATNHVFGFSVSSAGDVNGDGYGDVIVGAIGHASFTGKAYLYLGSATGLGTSPAWTATGAVAESLFGVSVSSAGDVNGDGLGDVVVGASNSESLTAGSAFVYLGTLTGLSATPAWSKQGADASYGICVSSVGDVNGDGYGDVAVGEPFTGEGAGQAYVYFGSATGVATSPGWSTTGGGVNRYFGRAISSAGDVNGDGFGDLIVGQYGSNSLQGNSYLYLGTAGGPSTTSAWSAAGQAAQDQFGRAVSPAGDTNGDGYGDVIIGASGASSEGGKAYLYLGNGGDAVGPGLPLRGQARQPNQTTLLSPWGRSTSQTSFDVAMRSARSVFGRLPVRLQVEVKKRGQKFNGQGLQVASSFTDSGLTGTPVNKLLTGLEQSDYHWRARVEHRPSRGVVQGWSRWVYGGISGQALGVHTRTGCTSALYYQDADDDGFGNSSASQSACSAPEGYVSSAGDCNDQNGAVNPEATEACNGIDDDCDDAIDEGVKSTFYADGDDDGFGNADSATQACTAPSGYVVDDTDCNDKSGTVYPGATETCNSVDDDCDDSVDEGVKSTFYADGDDDGFGDAGATTQACTAPSGYVVDDTDCNDAIGSVYPDAPESCNGIDDDCDDSVDEGVKSTFFADADSDGFGDAGASTLACTAPSGYVANATDCNDSNGAVYPGATETCNSVDDDCDESVDEGANASTFYADKDADGYGDPGSPVVACTRPEGSVTDNTDCYDTRDDVYPGAPEVCDGVDNDCDEAVDEAAGSTFYADVDGDGHGDAEVSMVACTPPKDYVLSADDCDDEVETTFPGAQEQCNEVDDDCDEAVDEVGDTVLYDDTDEDGYGDPTTGAIGCESGEIRVTNAEDCDDSDADVNPKATEVCDGKDNDCDSDTDETLEQPFFEDNDGDGYGDPDQGVVATCEAPEGYVSNAQDCNDADAAIHPGEAEVCDGVDNDCSGLIDDAAECDVSPTPGVEVEGGSCSCSSVPGTPGAAPAWLALVVAGLFYRRQRPHSARRSR